VAHALAQVPQYDAALPGALADIFTSPPRRGRCCGTPLACWAGASTLAQTGGYVLAPGSIIAGRPYVTVTPVPPVPLPAWLAARLTEPATPSAAAALPPPGIADPSRYTRAVLERECARVAQARHGRRNDALNRAAFTLGQLTPPGTCPVRSPTPSSSRQPARLG
jgi:hypothetical protein